MNIQNLIRKYNMKPHEENGSFAECHYPADPAVRAASGSAYFYLPPGERTLFHRIDCDEYWCHNAGACLEVWVIDGCGAPEIRKFGTDADAEPLLYFPAGVLFASRSTAAEGDGTFFTCITVPRFSYDGFRLAERDEVLALCPAARSFWD